MRIILLITLFVVLLGTFIISCKKSDNPEISYYIINIDSIVTPDTISFDQSLQIKFYGVIGPNGCYEFYRFEPNYDSNKLTIIPWGLNTNQEICTENLPMLYGTELLFNGLNYGESEIIVMKPDSTKIRQLVFVK